MRALSVLLFIIVFAVSALPVFAQAGSDRELKPVIRYSDKRPGAFFPGRPFRTDDPVPGLTEEDKALVKASMTDDDAETLLSTFVDRIENTYEPLSKAPEGFFKWLSENPDVRRIFLLALSPYYDDLPGAVRVLNDLRLAAPEDVAKYPHLAVSLALVWDTEDSLLGSRYGCIWGITAEQFRDMMTPREIFTYFTDEERQATFAFTMNELQWPMLVHVVDFDLSKDEIDWAWGRMAKYLKRIGSTYAMVPYDNQKLNTGRGKLGSKPYILPNLLLYGGVCGDQAHFCSRVAKCFGIPAMKAGGLSRYGGQGHAFTCFLEYKKKKKRRKELRPVLSSTGRYQHDMYYRGTIYDPQTRTRIIDRTLALMLDGASLSYKKYEISQGLVRMAEKHYAGDPDLSRILTKKALTLNWFCAPGWRLLMGNVKDGRISPKDGITWANNMMKFVSDHPDLTFDCFSTFLTCFPEKETKKRQAFYKQAAKLYTERPDLLIDLRHAQGLELIRAEKEGEAIHLFLTTAAENNKAGRLILPLVEKGVELVRKKRMEARAVKYIEKIHKRFPKRRGGKIAEAYQKLARLLVPVYEAAGKQKDADKLKRDAQLG